MSAKFEECKRFWDLGVWDEKKMRNAVVKEWITANEFFLITGKNY